MLQSLMKLLNTEVIRLAQISEAKFYYMQKHHPKLAEMLKKGVIADKLLNPDIFSDILKKGKKK